ncbi:Deuterosome Assembly Protein 1 [Manis pentadactyla]|nr:Deuterosome Assembly Protein 1 [Manis pentadactyla]
MRSMTSQRSVIGRTSLQRLVKKAALRDRQLKMELEIKEKMLAKQQVSDMSRSGPVCAAVIMTLSSQAGAWLLAGKQGNERMSVLGVMFTAQGPTEVHLVCVPCTPELLELPLAAGVSVQEACRHPLLGAGQGHVLALFPQGLQAAPPLQDPLARNPGARIQTTRSSEEIGKSSFGLPDLLGEVRGIVKDSEDNNRITEDHKVFKCTRDFTQEAKQTKHLAEVQLL